MSGAEGEMRAIWKSSGLHLTRRMENGWLAVTPDFLRAYYTRPEIHPVEESCDAEIRLFERLMADPAAPVSEADLASIADRDTAENYAVVLRFRDHLLDHGAIEAAYRALFAPGAPMIPPMFIDQMTHLIVANILAEETDPLVARAAEIFFREQTAMTENEQIMLADTEVVETRAQSGALLGAGAEKPREVALDILAPETAAAYWERADRFDFALDFRFAEPGQDAFARMLERWLKHFLALPVRIQPLQSVRDQRWSWHVGLDAEATAILNALYEGRPLEDGRAARLAALFRLEFLDRDRATEAMRGRPVFLGLAVGEGGTIRMKPQNLLVGLPLAEARH